MSYSHLFLHRRTKFLVLDGQLSIFVFRGLKVVVLLCKIISSLLSGSFALAKCTLQEKFVASS